MVFVRLMLLLLSYLLEFSLDAAIQSSTVMCFLVDLLFLCSYMLETLRRSLSQSSTIILLVDTFPCSLPACIPPMQ